MKIVKLKTKESKMLKRIIFVIAALFVGASIEAKCKNGICKKTKTVRAKR